MTALVLAAMALPGACTKPKPSDGAPAERGAVPSATTVPASPGPGPGGAAGRFGSSAEPARLEGAGGAGGGPIARAAATDDQPVPPIARPHALGERIESVLFDFRVKDLRACGAGAPAAKPASPSPAPAAGEPTQLGAFVSIVAKLNNFSISPRDLTLETPGMVLRAQFPAASPIPRCAPALPVTIVKRGQTTEGVAEFKIPPGFPARGEIPRLVYRPTRWGGADPVEVNLPACLADCPQLAAPPKVHRRDRR